MKCFTSVALALLIVVLVPELAAEDTHSIPAEKVDCGAICWGDASGFAKPAYVDYKALIASTPEYKEMKKKKLSSSDPASWILMSKAADRVASAINEVAKDTGYDLICEKQYWTKMELGVRAPDITRLVRAKIAQEEK